MAAINALASVNAVRIAADPDHVVILTVLAQYKLPALDTSINQDPDPHANHAENAARFLINLASGQDVVYVVPGDPLNDDPTTLMLAATACLDGESLKILSPGKAQSKDCVADIRMLTAIMSRLRDPLHGCPWDREQTLAKLKRFALEETYEVLEAIDSGVPGKHSEELGDLLLQIVFQSQLAKEAGEFDISEVISSISTKLLRRHPHIFGDIDVANTDEVLKNWEAIKSAEPGYEDRTSILDGIPIALPALMRALEVSKRVVKVGFEWPEIDQVLDKVDEELSELRAEIKSGDRVRAAEEVGDLLFTFVNVARQLDADPEEALRGMTLRFANRFREIERYATVNGRGVSDLSLEEMEEQWQLAKQGELKNNRSNLRQ
jgi:MazG family protein